MRFYSHEVARHPGEGRGLLYNGVAEGDTNWKK